MLRLRVEMLDRPGALARVTGVLAAFRGDIVQITVIHRDQGIAVDDIFMRLLEPDQSGSICEAVGRLPDTRVVGSRQPASLADIDAQFDMIAYLFAAPQRGLEAFVDMLPSAIDADWTAIRAADGSLLYHSDASESVDAELSVSDALLELPIADGVVLQVGRHPGLSWHFVESRRIASVLELAAQLVRACGPASVHARGDLTAWLLNTSVLATR